MGSDTFLVLDIKRLFKDRIDNLNDGRFEANYWVDFSILGELTSKDISKLISILQQYPRKLIFTIYAMEFDTIGILIADNMRDMYE